MRGGAGLQKTLHLGAYLNTKLSLGIKKFPCVATLENWVLKSGYKIYKDAQKKPIEKEASAEYAQIIDESMMVGSQKVLLSLAVAAKKRKNSFLSLSDCQILGMDVAENWDGERIQKVLERNTLKKGKAPR